MTPCVLSWRHVVQANRMDVQMHHIPGRHVDFQELPCIRVPKHNIESLFTCAPVDLGNLLEHALASVTPGKGNLNRQGQSLCKNAIADR